MSVRRQLMTEGSACAGIDSRNWERRWDTVDS